MSDDADLKKTPLYDLHVALGARMVPFAGYLMPVSYPLGVLKEHLHVRAAAGLFDVSHMGQVALHPRSGDIADACLALESLVPADILGLKPGRQRYGVFTNAKGGIEDDLMITHRGDHLFLVVNASRKDEDVGLMQAAIGEPCEIRRHDDRALLALQGPAAERVLAELWADVASLRFMDVAEASIHDVPCLVSRSGYSGEDGFEISMPAKNATDVAKRLLEHPDCEAIGLGARDSLRLEAGLCLYGNDLDPATSPAEAAIEWSIQKVRRQGGARAGGFPGSDRILTELAEGARRRRVGLRPEGRAPVRDGATLFADAAGRRAVGCVTSGGFGPSVGAPVAMGYVDHDVATVGTPLFAEVRGKFLPLAVSALPFTTPTYKR
ncbi:glycine cleavage system aminomethyltransferase GcvT [Ensifer soli]|uniref:glycine cleavage system aminomethyltransferase GcvT n=1 Tax=Ciceribacter sp. sgz301302 TaxID=3342379 RepID=UPI0035B74B8E